jgi:hypothetical protein
MHLIQLTAVQSTPFNASLDLRREEQRLHDAILMALTPPSTAADVIVRFTASEVTVSVTVKDADSAFAVLAPVFSSSPFCGSGNVVLKYGQQDGASKRTVNLARATASLIAHSDKLPYE